MLLSFKIKNFRSFKDEQEISFILGKNERSDKSRRFEVKTNNGIIRVLKNAFIYGANASGKSNIFKALINFSDIVLNPTMSDNQGLFADTYAGNRENIAFEVNFIKNNSIFCYLLEYNQQEIVLESLKKDNKVIFKREKQDFSFMTDNERIDFLIPTIRKTSLALFFAQNNNIEAAKEAFSWFFELRNFPTENVYELLKKDAEFKQNVLYALRFSDFNILDIEVEENRRPVFSFGMTFDVNGEEQSPNDPKRKMTMQNFQEVYLVHENNGKKFRVILESESEGTQTFFNYITLLLSANSHKELVILSDEFDKSLHKKLSQSFVKLLNSENNNIQFISTTHDSKLMDLLQKHQIYFVEKNSSGASEVFKLSDFEDLGITRKDAKFSTKYEDGLFGASQIINEAGLLNILRGAHGQED